jgi:hypothetical protein
MVEPGGSGVVGRSGFRPRAIAGTGSRPNWRLPILFAHSPLLTQRTQSGAQRTRRLVLAAFGRGIA